VDEEETVCRVLDGVAESAPLYPYQKEGAEWLGQKKFALLADDPGLGKTAQAIRACDLVGARKIVVLCPAIARFNWVREFMKFSWRSCESRVAMTTASDAVGSPDIVVCSYDLLTNKKVGAWLRSKPRDVVILDEAHYLKNAKAKRTQAAFALTAERIWALSGTPAPNHAAELWPLLHHFQVYAGDYWSFVNRFCKYYETPYGIQITGTQRVDELRALMAPILLRRKKDDVLTDLPKIAFHDVVVPPNDVDLELYYPELTLGLKTEAEIMARLDAEQASIDAVVNLVGMGGHGVAALAAMNAKVAASRRYTGLQKVDAIIEIITAELEANLYEKIVIFAVHRDVIMTIRNRMQAFKAVTLFGGVEPNKRERFIRDFQTKDNHRVIVANIQAAGTAITLTAANQVAFAECSWVPAENAQAAMRVHRIGQTKPVTVRFFGLADSSDERVARVLRRKTRDLIAIFDAPESADEPTGDPFK
jgi:SWI/SNF-related matrix-associated actin-dependent regulator 1 of chromatin subfamily A